jgi:hypothetical protein
MKRSFFALITMVALALSAISFSFVASVNAQTAARQTNRLAAQLPNSDGVVVMDMQRLTKEALPQFLAGKVEFLNEINTRIDDIKMQTGIDLRNFEQVAVGVMFKEIAPQKLDYEPIVLARGKINSGALLATAKLAASGKYREEKSGVKTIYVFAAKEIMQAHKRQTMTPKEEEDFNKTLARIPAEIAATAFDDSTLAIGSLARVRETLEAKPRISPNLLTLVNRKPSSVLSFAANLPQNAARFFNLPMDELAKTIDAIQQASGTVDVVGANTVASIVAKTYKPEQAKDLEDTLAGLQMLGKGFLAMQQGDDKKIYAKMVESAKISRVASEVMLDVQVANSDLSVLLGKK